MMTTEDTTQKKHSWRVRMDGGQIYAASDLEELQQWARDGRVAPANELSIDDGPWQPLASCRELAMDWVAEVSPGVLYGPVHRSAIEALIADGSLSAEAALFRRKSGPDQARTAREIERERELNARIEELAKSLAAAEQSLRSARVESEEAKGTVAARDLEAGAERQEHQAAVTRLNAEVAKRDAHVSALELKCRELESALEKSRRDNAAAAALERRASDAERALAAADEAAKAAREDAQEARSSLAAARAELAKARRQADDAIAAARSVRLREDSVRKLLQQALSAVENGAGQSRAASEETIDVVIDDTAATPPPMGGATLGAIEAQAMDELRRFGSASRGNASKGGK